MLKTKIPYKNSDKKIEKKKRKTIDNFVADVHVHYQNYGGPVTFWWSGKGKRSESWRLGCCGVRSNTLPRPRGFFASFVHIDQEPRIQVKVMHQSWSGTRKLWKWPEGKSHEVFYFTVNVVQKIGLPIHTTQRADTFTFDKDMKCKLYPPKMYTCILGNTWGLTVFKFKWFTDKAK